MLCTGGQFILLSLLCVWIGFCDGLPPGFVDEGIGRVVGSTGANFVPNVKSGTGHVLYVTSKEGLLYVFENPDTSSSRRVVLDITDRICSNGERGLQGITPHPNFEENRWLYMYYTYDENMKCLEDRRKGPVNRLVRAKVKDDLSVDMKTEEVLLETSPLEYDHHNGGAMLFGNDGYLYVAIGDGGSREEGVSQTLGDTLGTLVRLTDDGGIPPDNPFAQSDNSARCHLNGVPQRGDEDTMCQEIWAFGLRNPFRFAMNYSAPNVHFHINDVGANEWEEINAGGTDFPGVNYGWPIREGPCENGSSQDCTAPSHTDPFHYYMHSEEGAAATGGAFIPPGVWPDKYDNQYLFWDFVIGEIYLLRHDESLECRDCIPPVSAYANETFHAWPRGVDLFFGPYKDTQALYYTARQGDENLRRIRFRGGLNSAPLAVLLSNATTATIGAAIEFDASNSTDPDGSDNLTYEWDFGDGSKATDMEVVKAFESMGTFQVRLTVSDLYGFISTDFVTIVIGVPPTIKMVSPPEGATFAVGDVFTLSATAEDSEGNSLPAESMFWEVRQHHKSHYHPFLNQDTQGNNIVLSPAPQPEDFEAAGNSYLEVILKVVDSNNVFGVLSRKIMPQTVHIELESHPPGINITLDEYPVTLPVSALSWIGHDLRLDIPETTQDGYSFVTWSDGKAIAHSIRVRANSPKVVVCFESTTESPTTDCKDLVPSSAADRSIVKFSALFTFAALVLVCIVMLKLLS